MVRSISVAIENGVVKATVKGDIEPRRSPHAIDLAMGVASKAHIDRLLFDIRDARYKEYHVMAMRHAQQSGIHRFRIAVVGNEGDPKLAYFENVARNRGIRLKSFTSPEAASRWLRGA
jgi:hypothetical protein